MCHCVSIFYQREVCLLDLKKQFPPLRHTTIKICLKWELVPSYNNHWRLCLYGFLQRHRLNLQLCPPRFFNFNSMIILKLYNVWSTILWIRSCRAPNQVPEYHANYHTIFSITDVTLDHQIEKPNLIHKLIDFSNSSELSGWIDLCFQLRKLRITEI